MCLNALAGVFVFSRGGKWTLTLLRVLGLNALAGVFVFSPKRAERSNHVKTKRLNALAGVFVFSHTHWFTFSPPR